MTSVLSRLLPSNGSNALLAIFLFSILFASCGGTDKATKRTTNTKKPRTNTTTTKSTKKTKVKEIEWTEGSDTRKPPITSTKKSNTSKPEAGTAEIIKENSYDITYFIPFDANAYVGSANASDRFVQYYAGMEVATGILEKEGVNLNVNVVDEKKRRFDLILEDEVHSETDVIVGPYDRKDLKTAAKFAKDNRIPLVSPWQASSKIAKENPYYIQLRPNLDEHYYSIFEDIKKNYDVSQVYVIGRNTKTNDVKRTQKMQKMAADVWESKEKDLLQEYNVIQDSIDYGVTAFDSIFTEEKPTVVVIPHWSFKDEAFIYGSLRRLSVEKGLAEVIVYGMPIMLESEKINFDYYSSLNMRVARSKFVDSGDYDVARFKRDFVNKYGALPTDDAYEGYDNLMYIGRNLNEYGKNFQYYLDKDQGYYLQAGYDVTPTRANSSDDALGEIKYFENKNVDIIVFKNARFARELD